VSSYCRLPFKYPDEEEIERIIAEMKEEKAKQKEAAFEAVVGPSASIPSAYSSFIKQLNIISTFLIYFFKKKSKPKCLFSVLFHTYCFALFRGVRGQSVHFRWQYSG